ncbi:MAG: 3-methyladenine DNA glycosylase/8-oxoguanine DNA glycosylase [Candidatus Methanohalarchaeum thermophilum]|uniref:DNA-(apurinic or apyrimidinic site) lyase n=1 Tax=Methanohalarchaeum thermophilum TaxID=1903181 RepID=A0A1Q6DXV9_METT1|nr:MAG: 3-methyladenine DNA glycosylase/8-oxoguanine DNA glycosylase [Candidatus Methanohalarchaeum thermophilum]
MMKIPKKEIDMEKTLFSGQPLHFVFNEIDRGYIGYLKDGKKYSPIMIKEEDKNYIIKSELPQTKIKEYFGLKEDLNRVYQKIETDNYIKKAIKNYRGLRITKTDPLLSIVVFIVSSNNNLRNIRSFLTNLSREYGRKITVSGEKIQTPPRDKKLFNLTKEDFKKCKAGYRSKYLEKSLNMISTGEVDLDKIQDKENSLVKKELKNLYGVGEKVSECISLFSYKNLDAFPIDTNIRDIMKKRYLDQKEPKEISDNEIRELAKKKWKNYAGYAQQYLYKEAIS